MRIVLIGLGTVGQGFLEILRDKADDLRSMYGFAPQLVGVATRTRGTLMADEGLDVRAVLDAIQHGHLDSYPTASGLVRNLPTLDLLERCDAHVMLEAGTTDLQTAQPAIDHCYTSLAKGMHLVLANKGPIALAYPELMKRASKVGKHVLFEATVMAGTPSLRVALQALAGATISEARGILNGTTNYILTQMEGGMSYAHALSQAQSLGYAEADPTADVDGWDAASKVLIFAAALFGKQLTLSEMQVRGISHLTSDDIEAARAAGERWKLIARVTPHGGSVEPLRIPVTHPLASVGGAANAVTYVTDMMGEITLVGPGAGRRQTGFALLSDLLDLHRLGV